MEANTHPFPLQRHDCDVCVVGGGMAGLCAALASARNGARTVLIQDRPVLGGNASSEVRMWVCGAHGEHNRESGLVEEIKLENAYRNPALNYCIWDGVLYGKAFYQPNLTPLLNCSVLDAEMDGDRIVAVKGWQLTTQTQHLIHAKHFIDCSGDSVLAPLSGAAFRTGRESCDEFDESIQPSTPDAKTMGNSLLLQLRRCDEPQPFTPPAWAYKFTRPQDLPHRLNGVNGSNFWWIEVGGLQDTITDAEAIRDDLMRITYGVWDYIKNHAPEREKAANWAVEFIGAVPGKRESRRYLGDHVLTQNDIRARGGFDDIVAYGGWSMDDHHPAGLLYPGSPTIFHEAPSPYGIPLRSLYSRNIANLLFAGRNISATHAALSSTRVMGTCAVLGQAAGTAAALCVRHGCDPRSLSGGERLRQLQHRLMDDDAWLPGLARPVDALTRAADLAATSAGADHPGDANVARLLDGTDRDRPGECHAWAGSPGDALTFTWPQPVPVAGLRLVLDSNLANDKRMPCSYPQKGDRCLVPSSLLRSFRVESVGPDGSWVTVHRETNNYQRLLRLPLNVCTAALRVVPESTWGDEEVRIFACEATAQVRPTPPQVPQGPHFSKIVAQVAPSDLAPPPSRAQPAGAAISGAEQLTISLTPGVAPGITPGITPGIAPGVAPGVAPGTPKPSTRQPVA